jgi:hypothetical protein
METSPALQPIVASTIRHGLTALAGVLVARGFLVEGDTAEFVSVGVGLVIGAVGYGWSLARAGRLGSQARTIAGLMDRLLMSMPLPDPGTTTSVTPASDGSAPVIQSGQIPAATQLTNNDTGQS